jgi:hypothetical protein
MSLSSPILTPLPFSPGFFDEVPAQVAAVELRFRAKLLRPQVGQAAPRAALTGSLQILRHFQSEAPWIHLVLTKVREEGSPMSSDPLEAWSDTTLLTFLKHLLMESWNKETCAANDRGRWNERVPEVGQSAISALLVQELLGGRIRRGTFMGVNCDMYFYNERIPNEPFELTRARFSDHAQMMPGNIWEREALLNTQHDRGQYAAAAKVPERYALLKSRFLIAAAAMALASSRVLSKVAHD